MSLRSVFSLSLGGTNKLCDECTVVDVQREQRPTKEKLKNRPKRKLKTSLVFSMAIIQKVPIFRRETQKKLEGVLDDISKKKIEINNTIITWCPKNGVLPSHFSMHKENTSFHPKAKQKTKRRCTNKADAKKVQNDKPFVFLSFSVSFPLDSF